MLGLKHISLLSIAFLLLLFLLCASTSHYPLFTSCCLPCPLESSQRSLFPRWDRPHRLVFMSSRTLVVRSTLATLSKASVTAAASTPRRTASATRANSPTTCATGRASSATPRRTARCATKARGGATISTVLAPTTTPMAIGTTDSGRRTRCTARASTSSPPRMTSTPAASPTATCTGPVSSPSPAARAATLPACGALTSWRAARATTRRCRAARRA